MNLKYFIVYFCTFNTTLQAARILSIFLVPDAGQYAFIEPLLKELAGRGHQITSMTNFPQTQPVKNFRDVVVQKNKHLFDDFKNFTLDYIETNFYDIIESFYSRASQLCTNIFEDPTVHEMFENESFDLIILEVLFSESFFGLAEHFKAPIVGVSTLGTMHAIDALVGNISPLSYLPNLILPLREMKVWQRFLNIIVHSFEWCQYYIRYLPLQKKIYNQYFPNAKISFKEAQKNFALVLLNDHFSLTMPRPYVPNMIEVAGMHINTKLEPLPRDIQIILDSAKEGAIFVNIDSVISSKVMETILQQFQDLKQIIIWKTSLEISNAPANVYINSNYAQTSILAHPNIKLFISYGGFLDITESIYHGIPILGLPPNDRAQDYVDFIKRVGNGLSIKQKYISKKTLSKALNELLNSSYYTDLAKLLSKRFRDQQTTPMERAVYWIEYVLRHNGAAHLRNLGQNLEWYEFYNIDVLVLLFCFIYVLIYLPYFFIKTVSKLFCRTNFKIKRL